MKDWIAADVKPKFDVESWGVKETHPLLVFDKEMGKKIARLRDYCDGEDPVWVTCCSNGWTLSSVTHYTELPDNPGESK